MAFDDDYTPQDEGEALAQYLQDQRKRKQLALQAASVAAGAPRGSSFLPDGTPITDDDGGYLSRRPEAAPDPAPDTRGREQFGLPPLPASKNIGPAPGVAEAPAATPYALAPRDENAPMPGYTPAAPPTPARGSSNYGDVATGLGALSQFLGRLGAPGLHDRSDATAPLANLPAALQARQLHDQQIRQNDMTLASQADLQRMASSPEFQQQLASLPPVMRMVAEAAAKRGDVRTMAYATGLTNYRGQPRAGVAGSAVGPHGERAPSGYAFDASGNLAPIPGGPHDPAVAGKGGGKLTNDQANAGLYADRMSTSSPILGRLSTQGTSLWNKILDASGVMGNYGKSDEAQQFSQAERDFINATLRRESGAAISEGEFVNARQQYIPQPGDSDAVLKQKAQNRAVAIHGIARAAGNQYYSDFVNKYGTPDQPAQPAQGGGNSGNGSFTREQALEEARRRGLVK